MKVILITGKSGVGKDTVARILSKELQLRGKYVSVLSNALAVKNIAKDMFQWKGNKDGLGRKLLIDITETGYNYDKYFWEKKSHKAVIDKLVDYLIVPDWRYLSTYEYWKENAEEVITIRKLGRSKYNYSLDINKDKSEIGLDTHRCDMQIQSFGNLENLGFDIESKANEILKVTE